MAEGTAGIGEAGALVNRATAPNDMAITKGLMYREQNDLKKAAAEAQRLAKEEQRKEALSKYIKRDFGKFKNLGVSKLANEAGMNYIAKANELKEKGDEMGLMELQANLAPQTDMFRHLDETVSELKSRNNPEAKMIADQLEVKGEVPAQKWYAKHVSINPQTGTLDVHTPKKPVNYVSKIVGNLKGVNGADIEYENIKDAIVGNEKFLMKSKLDNNQINQVVVNTVADPEYANDLTYDPTFQKYFENDFTKKLGITQKDLESLPEDKQHELLTDAIIDFTEEKVKAMNENNVKTKMGSNFVNRSNENVFKIEGGGYRNDEVSYVPTKENPNAFVPSRIKGAEKEIKNTTITNKQNKNLTFNTITQIYKVGDNDFFVKGTDADGNDIDMANVPALRLNKTIGIPLVALESQPINKDVIIEKERDEYANSVSDPTTAERIKKMTPLQFEEFKKIRTKKPVTESTYKREEPKQAKKLNIKASTNTLSMFGVDTNAVKSNKPK